MNWFTWTPLEAIANLFTIVCIVLAGRNNIHTWWTGIVGCILFAVLFYNNQLYADMILQGFFLVTGIIGWMNWKSTTDALPITNANKSYVVSASGIAVLTAICYGYILHTFTDAYAPWIDSIVLTFSVVAQLLLMRKNIETWYFWILVNTLSVPLFWSRELYLTSILYVGFWCNAVYSAWYWKKCQYGVKNDA